MNNCGFNAHEEAIIGLVLIVGFSFLFATMTYNYLKHCKPNLFAKLIGDKTWKNLKK